MEFAVQESWEAIRGGCLAAFSLQVPGLEDEQVDIVFELAPGKYSHEVLAAQCKIVAEAVTLVSRSGLAREMGPSSGAACLIDETPTPLQRTGLVPHRLVAVRDRTIPKTTSGKIRRKATKEAMLEGTLHVIYDTLGGAGGVSRQHHQPGSIAWGTCPCTD